MTDTPTSSGSHRVAEDTLSRKDLDTADTPKSTQFQWRASCSWVSGQHSRSTVSSYHGLGAEQKHKSAFIMDTDHPELLAADDNGATPAEHILVALAGCLTAGIASIARHRSIPLRSVTARVSGGMNITGIADNDSDVRSRFDNIKVVYSIDADATIEEILNLVAQSQKRSPIFYILSHPASVTVDVA